MEQQSIKSILIHFFIVSTGLFSILFILFIVLGNLAINVGWAFRADYPQSLVPALEKKVESGTLQPKDIPDIFNYRIKENDKTIVNTFPKNKQKKVERTAVSGQTQGATLLTREVFVPLKGKKQELILSYRVVSDFTSSHLRKTFPTFESLELTFFLCSLSCIFFFTLRYYSHKLQIELDKISQANHEISQLNLAFPNQKSKVKEIDEILSSIDQLKNSLNQSLQKQWKLQNDQETNLQGLLHDLRTPLTLIRGNLELLEETELSTQQIEFINDAKNGVTRLEHQTERLKQVTKIGKPKILKSMIDQTFLDRCKKLVLDLAKTKQLSVIFLSNETSDFNIEIEPLFQAIQNLIQNSVEMAPEKSSLYLSFKKEKSSYQIKICDEGPGFSEESLQHATEKNYSTKANQHNGLGLYLVQCYMDAVGGDLQIRNVTKQSRTIGAEVILSFSSKKRRCSSKKNEKNSF